MPAPHPPGTIWRNNGRFWWRVRLPGQDKRSNIPLVPRGGTVATDDPAVALEIARERWQRALSASADPKEGGGSVAVLVAA